MSEQQSSPEIPDEQDVEIIDLDTAAHGPARATRPIPSPLAPRFTSKQRGMQLIATVSIILLVLLVLLGSYGPTRSVMLGSIFPPPKLTTTLAPGLDRFYIQAQPGWGHLSIDGKPIAYLPVFDRDAPLLLSRGQHRLDWVAAPFASQHCIVSVPAQFRQDACPLTVVTFPSPQPSAWLLTFTATMDLLPDVQRVALTQAIQAALDREQSSDIVQPGEHYAISNVQHPIVIATQPLRATLHFQIDTNTQGIAFCIDSLFGMPSTSCRINNQDCRTLCQTYFAQPSATPNEWLTFGVIRTAWDYATLDGRVIAREQPEIADEAGTNEHILPLRISWDGSTWHVGTTFTLSDLPVPYANPVCFPSVDDFQMRGDMTAPIPDAFSYSLKFVSASVHAKGCLVTVKLEQPSPNPGGNNGSNVPTPNVVSTAYVLQRFGVFLAANAAAHQLWPTIPIANEYEQNIAQQMRNNAVNGQNI